MNAPKRIWVDSCKDADGEPEWDTGAWGHEQQEGDEEYVRADLFAKAVEALRKIGKTYSADGFRLIHSDRQIINMVYIVLAELEKP